MVKENVNVCIALDLISKAIENEKGGITIYKELDNIGNPEYGFGNSFLYFRHDDEKHLERLQTLNRRLNEMKQKSELHCTGNE